MKVLVTGGTGYLGQNICLALSDCGHEAVIIDPSPLSNKLKIPGCYYYKASITDRFAIERILQEHKDIECVIHCVTMGTVEQSVTDPYVYYNMNVMRSIELFYILKEYNIKKIIFSSSALVYDTVPGFMVTERSPIKPRNPFGRGKYMTEMILKDFCNAYGIKCISMRYFNPVGVDPKGRCLLLKRNSTTSNLLARLLSILYYEEKSFVISGTDWETRDGTCIRDYVHAWDVAMANVKTVENFESAFEKAGEEYSNYLSMNIGSGVDVTVREFIMAFENVTGEKIRTIAGQRRQGDVAGSYANISLAKRAIDWEPKLTIEDAILDMINYEEKVDLL
jgi:UDP-glucose 4-epimerase